MRKLKILFTGTAILLASCTKQAITTPKLSVFRESKISSSGCLWSPVGCMKTNAVPVWFDPCDTVVIQRVFTLKVNDANCIDEPGNWNLYFFLEDPIINPSAIMYSMSYNSTLKEYTYTTPQFTGNPCFSTYITSFAWSDLHAHRFVNDNGTNCNGSTHTIWFMWQGAGVWPTPVYPYTGTFIYQSTVSCCES